MKSETRFYLIAILGIVLFDALGSLASRELKFDYTVLVWPSRMLYVVAGYFGFGYIRFVGGLLAGLVVGLADATLGWAVSIAIHPYLRQPLPHLGFGVIVAVIVIASVYAAFFGFIGGLLRWLVGRLQPRNAIAAGDA